MKKIISKMAAAAVLLCGAASCSSVDLAPTNQYDVSYAFTSQENCRLYLNYFYQVFGIFSPFGSCALGGSNSSMSDGLTEILKYGAMVAGAGDCNLIMTVDGQQSASQNYFDCWTTGYGWIRRFNEFLDGLNTYPNPFTAEQKAQFKAEVLMCRAFVEFNMMRSHASKADDLGIILRQTLADMTTANNNTPRSSLADCWNAIAADLDFAIANLPEPDKAASRLNRYAACALKARAMLYAERYADALAATDLIVAGDIYGYLDDYSAVFKDLANKEVIFGYGYTPGTQTHTFDLRYSQPGDYCDSGSKGGGYAGPTQEFVDAFDNADGTAFDASDVSRRFITSANVGSRDPRLAASVLYNGAMWKGRKLQCCEGGIDQKYMPYGTVNNPGNTVTGYYMRKLLDESNVEFDLNGSSQPWPEFRYAEVMLIRAECQARALDFDAARNTVHELRQARFGRADVYTAPVSSLGSALDLILHERMVELCFEDHRFWDLRRTGRAQAVLDGRKYTGVMWKEAGGTFVPESVDADMGVRHYPSRFDAFPIPQTEISNNKQARQNKDW